MDFYKRMEKGLSYSIHHMEKSFIRSDPYLCGKLAHCQCKAGEHALEPAAVWKPGFSMAAGEQQQLSVGSSLF